MFVKKNSYLSVMIFLVFITIVLGDKYAFAQTNPSDGAEVFTESPDDSFFTDQTFAEVPLPAFVPNAEGSPTYVIVTLKFSIQSSILIKIFAVEKESSLSDDSNREFLTTVAFRYSSPSEKEKQVDFLVAIPPNLPFVPSDLYLEFYSASTKGEEAPEKRSGQVLPVVLYQ